MAYSIASDSLRLDSNVGCYSASESLSFDAGKHVPEMFCEFCIEKKIHSAATGFCVDCVEYYCDVCFGYHARFQPKHVLQKSQSMPRDFCLEKCETHDTEVIKFVCLDCDQVACSLCKQKRHEKCKNLKHIPAYVKSETFNGTFLEYMNNLNSIKTRLQTALKTTKINSTEIESYCYVAKARVKKHRHEINMMLDRLESEIENIIATRMKRDQSAMESLTVKYEALATTLNPIHSSLDMLKQTGQLSKSLVTMQQSKSKIDDIENKMVVLREESKDTIKDTGIYEFVPQMSILKLNSLGKLVDTKTDITDQEISYTDSSTHQHAVSIREKEYSDKIDVQALPSLKLSVAVFGDSGSGKSVLINNLLGVNNKDEKENCCYSADASITKWTSIGAKYPHVVAYEFHSVETFKEHEQLKTYDIFIIISSGRFNENHIQLAEEINKSCFETLGNKVKNKPLYFVRSHLHDDIENDQRAHPKTHAPLNVINNIAEDCKKKLGCHLSFPIFLIDSYEKTKYQFKNLLDAFNQDVAEITTRCVLNLK